MCGRSTYTLTWEEIVRLYQLTLDQPAQNMQRAGRDGCGKDDILVAVHADALPYACLGLLRMRDNPEGKQD
jgi:hypothetical protein